MGQPQGHNAERKTAKNVFGMIVYMHFISCISVKKTGQLLSLGGEVGD